MYKYAVFNDLHIADNSPIGRVPGYQDHIFDKLIGCATVLEQAKVDLAVFTGDIFHVKRPDRVSHALVNRMVDFMRNDIPCPVLICPGNHDLTEAGIASLPRQPLGTIFESEAAFPLIKGENWYPAYKGKIKIAFFGRHYDTDGDLDPSYYPMTDEEAGQVERAGAGLVVLVAHGSIVPPDADPIYPHVNINRIDWEDAPMEPDVLHAGHLHEDYGIVKKSGCPIFTNLGSFGRPSRNQKDVDARDFLMVTVDDNYKVTMERTPIPNMLPASEVFYEKVEELENEDYAEFAATLANAIVLEDTSIDEALDSLGQDISPAVRARLRKYLEEENII